MRKVLLKQLKFENYSNMEYGFEVKYNPRWKVIPFVISNVFEKVIIFSEEGGERNLSVSIEPANYSQFNSIKEDFKARGILVEDYYIEGGLAFKHGGGMNGDMNLLDQELLF
ncbi:MAG: hypothetical protein MNSN_05010 [Minisyncoccus archaeiphilus]|jgi:hypothetical protein|uniref:hypothetical protein n=1 Tax=Minisyncoccus archaeiphilus TaxID=3238481 RepID=UPI002B0DDF19|nr:MAG: hypothetical protein MNSN_05010 [Candidatus Parcubacteria bacterium]